MNIALPANISGMDFERYPSWIGILAHQHTWYLSEVCLHYGVLQHACHLLVLARTLLQHDFAVPAGMAGIDFGGAPISPS